MLTKGNVVKNELHDELRRIEHEKGVNFSNTQKVLLSIEGSITAILDVLYGTVSIFTLDQHFENVDAEKAELLEINEGDEINYREVLIHGRGRPMIYALSYIPLSSYSEEAREDIVGGSLPVGKILKKHKIESRREINAIYVEKPTPTLTELFKTTEDFISRDYVIISNGKIIMWTKESFPISSFSL